MHIAVLTHFYYCSKIPRLRVRWWEARGYLSSSKLFKMCYDTTKPRGKVPSLKLLENHATSSPSFLHANPYGAGGYLLSLVVSFPGITAY